MKDLLADLYESLRNTDSISPNIYIPISFSFYIKAHIKDKFGIDMPVMKVENLLYEEGLLPASFYGIPSWYARKYKINCPKLNHCIKKL